MPLVIAPLNKEFRIIKILQIIVRKAHSFRGGMESAFFYNLICMVLLISYIYYFIIYVWKIIIHTQTKTYL